MSFILIENIESKEYLLKEIKYNWKSSKKNKQKQKQKDLKY